MSERTLSLRVLSLVWACRAALGWLISLPFVAALSTTGVAELLDGDRALFEPGALWLAELLRLSAPELAAAARASLPALVLALAFKALLDGTLLAWASDSFSDALACFRAAWHRLALLLGVAVGEIVAKLLVLLLAALLGGAVAHSRLSSDEMSRSLPALGCALLALLAWSAVSVLADVRRALAFSRPRLRRLAWTETLAVASNNAPALSSGYALRTGLTLFAFACSARLVERIDVGRPGAWRVLAVLGLHQLTLALLTLLQAAWSRRLLAAAKAQPVAARL